MPVSFYDPGGRIAAAARGGGNVSRPPVAAPTNQRARANTGKGLGQDRITNAIVASRQAGPRNFAAPAAAEEPSGAAGLLGKGLGMVLNNPVVKTVTRPLDVLDVPRRFVWSTINEAVDEFNGGDDGGFSFQDWYDQTNPLHVVTQHGDTSFGAGDVIPDVTTGLGDNWDKWINRGIGLAGDIAADPLTYVDGIGFVADVGTISSRIGRMTKLAEGTEALEKVGGLTDNVIESAKKVAQTGNWGKADPLLREAAGVSDTAGVRFRVPFTEAVSGPLPGTEYLGGKLADVIGGVKGGINASDWGARRIAANVPKEYSNILPRLLSGSADDEKFMRALEGVPSIAARRKFTRKVSAIASKDKDKMTRQVKEYLRQGNTIDDLIRNTEDLASPNTPLNDFADRITKVAASMGVKMPEIQGIGYFPHVLSKEFKDLLANGGDDAERFLQQTDIVRDELMRDSGFLQGRKLRGTAERPLVISLPNGRTATLTQGTVAEINEKMAQLFPQMKGTALETDPGTAIERYISGVSQDIGNRAAAKERIAAGSKYYGDIGTPELRETLGEGVEGPTQQLEGPVAPRNAPQTVAHGEKPFAEDPFFRGVKDEALTTQANEMEASRLGTQIETEQAQADALRRTAAGDISRTGRKVETSLNEGQQVYRDALAEEVAPVNARLADLNTSRADLDLADELGAQRAGALDEEIGDLTARQREETAGIRANEHEIRQINMATQEKVTGLRAELKKINNRLGGLRSSSNRVIGKDQAAWRAANQADIAAARSELAALKEEAASLRTWSTESQDRLNYQIADEAISNFNNEIKAAQAQLDEVSGLTKEVGRLGHGRPAQARIDEARRHLDTSPNVERYDNARAVVERHNEAVAAEKADAKAAREAAKVERQSAKSNEAAIRAQAKAKAAGAADITPTEAVVAGAEATGQPVPAAAMSADIAAPKFTTTAPGHWKAETAIGDITIDKVKSSAGVEQWHVAVPGNAEPIVVGSRQAAMDFVTTLNESIAAKMGSTASEAVENAAEALPTTAAAVSPTAGRSLTDNQLRDLGQFADGDVHGLPKAQAGSLERRGLIERVPGKGHGMGNTPVWKATEDGKALAKRVEYDGGTRKYRLGEAAAPDAAAGKRIKLGSKEYDVVGETDTHWRVKSGTKTMLVPKNKSFEIKELTEAEARALPPGEAIPPAETVIPEEVGAAKTVAEPANVPEPTPTPTPTPAPKEPEVPLFQKRTAEQLRDYRKGYNSGKIGHPEAVSIAEEQGVSNDWHRGYNDAAAGKERGASYREEELRTKRAGPAPEAVAPAAAATEVAGEAPLPRPTPEELNEARKFLRTGAAQKVKKNRELLDALPEIDQKVAKQVAHDPEVRAAKDALANAEMKTKRTPAVGQMVGNPDGKGLYVSEEEVKRLFPERNLTDAAAREVTHEEYLQRLRRSYGAENTAARKGRLTENVRMQQEQIDRANRGLEEMFRDSGAQTIQARGQAEYMWKAFPDLMRKQQLQEQIVSIPAVAQAQMEVFDTTVQNLRMDYKTTLFNKERRQAERASLDAGAAAREGARTNLNSQEAALSAQANYLTGEANKDIEFIDQIKGVKGKRSIDPSAEIAAGKDLRPTKGSLKDFDLQTDPATLQPMNQVINDLKTMIAFDPTMSDDTYGSIESLLHQHKQALRNVSGADLTVRQTEGLLREANSGRLLDVVSGQLRDQWTMLPGRGDTVIDTELNRMLSNVVDAGKEPGMFGRTLTAFTNFFKTYATLTPGFHIRNAMSAVFMNTVDGVPLRVQTEGLNLWRQWEKAEDPLEWLGKQSKEVQDAFDATFASGAGGRFFESGVAESTASARSRLKEGVYRNRVTTASQKAGEQVEGSVRLGMALDSTRKGASVDAAYDRLARIHFDYASVSQMDEQAKKLVPFWTYTSRNLPMQISEMWKKPKVYAWYNSFVRNFEVDPAEFTPEYFDSIGAWNTGEKVAGMPLYIQPDLPQQRVQEDIDRFTKALQGENIGQVLSDFNPFFTAPVEYVTGTDLYTGTQYKDTDYTKAEGFADKAMLPLLKMLNQTKEGADGTYIQDKGMNAMRAINPLLDRSVRLIPGASGASGDPDRAFEAWARTMLAAPIRTLSPAQQRSAQRSQRFAKMDEAAMQRVLAGGQP